jgi:hypothetical protein
MPSRFWETGSKGFPCLKSFNCEKFILALELLETKELEVMSFMAIED